MAMTRSPTSASASSAPVARWTWLVTSAAIVFAVEAVVRLAAPLVTAPLQRDEVGWLLIGRDQQNVGREAAAAAALGIAVGMTPRALVPVAALLIARMLLVAANDGPRSLSRTAAWATASAAVTVLLLLLSADPAQIWKWMFVFSRAGGPPSPLMASMSWQALLPFWIAAAGAAAILVMAAVRRRLDSPHLVPALIVLSAWLAIFLEPRRFSQTMTFVATGTVVLFGSALDAVLPRSAAIAVPLQRTLLAVLTLTLSRLLLFQLPFGRPEDASGQDGIEQTVMRLQATRNEFAASLAAREDLCRHLSGESVLIEPTEWHPICLHDADFYWRGAEYILDGTLHRAGITEPAWDPAGAILRERPALIRTVPELEHRLEGQPAVRTLLEASYRKAGETWVRRDLATEWP